MFRHSWQQHKNKKYKKKKKRSIKASVKSIKLKILFTLV